MLFEALAIRDAKAAGERSAAEAIPAEANTPEASALRARRKNGAPILLANAARIEKCDDFDEMCFRSLSIQSRDI